MSKPGNLWRKVHGKITKKPTNFSWLINNKLAGSGMPTTSSEIDWVVKQGVKSIITMTEESLPESWIKNVKYLHVPTEDLSAPDMEQIDQAVEFIHERIQNEEPVMVHCAAGIGRTGTILACYLVKYHKSSAKDAIEKVRKERPGSIQSESQELAISLYYKHTNNS
ncbi:MAG: dual specificity protein phosphatase 23 [Nitrosotalea sp.]